MINPILELFILLIFAHALADFGLQSNTMAQRKSRLYEKKLKIEYEKKNPTEKFQPLWFFFLFAHSIIHGLCIWALTENMTWALLEIPFHFIIDSLKTHGKTNIHGDQFLHLCTKIFYLSL